MYEYDFVELTSTYFGRMPTENYRQIIIDKGRQGWELVQIFTSSTNQEGAPKAYDMIFKRKMQEG